MAAKKDDRVLELVEKTNDQMMNLVKKNNDLVAKIFDLLILIEQNMRPGTSNATAPVRATTAGPKQAIPAAEDVPGEEEPRKVTLEECRSALQELDAVKGRKEAIAFLASFNGSRTLGEVKKEHYPDFVARAKDVVLTHEKEQEA